ncbi:hypothetical protein [Spirosoma sp.]|uniref:hypothetical protein n=1 Tax=Spirosoma sp. TaxID=1899569 RepID=UPI00261E11FE|nr:hypothetical protein [Spirosoma sp.]MCX6214545.1 hypothetical protein [Spirosoma sp.]
MKKFIAAGCVAATLLIGYACTNSNDLTPADDASASARSGAVESGTATGPHSGTGRPGKPFNGTATSPHSGTGRPGTPPPGPPHSGTATPPMNGTGGPGGHPRGHGPK